MLTLFCYIYLWLLDMGHKKIIALPVLFVAMTDPAFAATVINPTITSVLASGSTPSSLDFTFDNRNLSVAITSSGTGTNTVYTLKASGVGQFSFYGTSLQPIAGTLSDTSYNLVANFNYQDQFIPTGSSLQITGALSSTASLPAGVTAPTTSTLLYSASLTDFGYSVAQGDIGFKTSFLTSWANQNGLTGGSTGESVYLFDQAALLNGGFGRLTQLVNAFNGGSLAPVVGKTYTSVQSVASVPLPMPALLFATGASALMGLARKRRNRS